MRRKAGQGQSSDRKQGVGSMVSYTSLSRAKAIQKLGKTYVLVKLHNLDMMQL